MTGYDRDGRPVTMDELGRRLVDPEYRRVALTLAGGAQISTIWLGIDHNHTPGGPPLIFETIFGGAYDQECERYSTEDDAVAGHQRWVETVAARADA